MWKIILRNKKKERTRGKFLFYDFMFLVIWDIEFVFSFVLHDDDLTFFLE